MTAIKTNGGTVTVGSKLPFDFIAEVGDVKVTFKGAVADTQLEGKMLTGGFGLTSGVDADFYAAWREAMGPKFGPLANGSIFAEGGDDKANDAAKERKKSVKSGYEQKAAEELGVVVVKDEG